MSRSTSAFVVSLGVEDRWPCRGCSPGLSEPSTGAEVGGLEEGGENSPGLVEGVLLDVLTVKGAGERLREGVLCDMAA
jgi:hypothetical protein